MSKAPIVYHFAPATGVFAGTSAAVASPTPGVWEYPAFATLKAVPPEIPEGQVAVFDPATEEWQLCFLQPSAGGAPDVVEATPAARLAALQAAVQSYLDGVAQGLGYDSIFTAVTYADEPAVPRFQEEGQALRAWRSEVWHACYELLDRVRSGDVAEPTIDQLPALLPAFSR